jgi:hypothetical protein
MTKRRGKNHFPLSGRMRRLPAAQLICCQLGVCCHFWYMLSILMYVVDPNAPVERRYTLNLARLPKHQDSSPSAMQVTSQ